MKLPGEFQMGRMGGTIQTSRVDFKVKTFELKKKCKEILF